VGTFGGGVWKTTNLTSGSPGWVPLTDALEVDLPGILRVGALELDPANPDVIFAGIGNFDHWLTFMPGARVLKSSDGGRTWGKPLAIQGIYPTAAGGGHVSARWIRDVRIDPTNSSRMLLATDGGLFRSTDGGSSFSLVDLPNSGDAQVEELSWSIAYLG